MAGHGNGSINAILYALVANIGIALAKGVATILTGSGAMLAETIHSLADCGNQVLLLFGTKKSTLPATAQHPLGRGREVYFWALIVALLLFTVGGLFSIFEGVERLLHPEPLTHAWVGIVVLLISIALEGWSLKGALDIIRTRQGTRTFRQWFFVTRQSELMVVVGEDIAALGGLVFALFALLLTVITGNPLFDALGSFFIGILLVIVAILVVREVKSLLVGESADPLTQEAITQFLTARDEIAEVYNLITLQLGDYIMVAAKVRMRETANVTKLIADTNACEAELKQRFPEISWVFFEPDNHN